MRYIQPATDLPVNIPAEAVPCLFTLPGVTGKVYAALCHQAHTPGDQPTLRELARQYTGNNYGTFKRACDTLVAEGLLDRRYVGRHAHLLVRPVPGTEADEPSAPAPSPATSVGPPIALIRPPRFQANPVALPRVQASPFHLDALNYVPDWSGGYVDATDQGATSSDTATDTSGNSAPAIGGDSATLQHYSQLASICPEGTYSSSLLVMSAARSTGSKRPRWKVCRPRPIGHRPVARRGADAPLTDPRSLFDRLQALRNGPLTEGVKTEGSVGVVLASAGGPAGKAQGSAGLQAIGLLSAGGTLAPVARSASEASADSSSDGPRNPPQSGRRASSTVRQPPDEQSLPSREEVIRASLPRQASGIVRVRKKPGPKRTPPDPRVDRFLMIYRVHYQGKFHEPWKSQQTGRDKKILKGLVASFDPDLLQAAADYFIAFVRREDNWMVKQYGHSIPTFAAMLPALLEQGHAFVSRQVEGYRSGALPSFTKPPGVTHTPPPPPDPDEELTDAYRLPESR